MITQEDLDLTNQRVLNIRIKIDVYDKDNVYVDTLDFALISGSFNMDANSDVRRTASFVLSPYQRVNILIEEDSLVWINRNIVMYVGIQSHRTQEYVYYKLGTFIIMTYGSTYDAVTNQLTINCSDWMAKLDGTKNGELGALITSFPAYKEFYSTESTGGTDCYYFTSNRVHYYSQIFQVDSSVHTKYTSGDYVVLQIPVTNYGADKFRWNSLPTIPIYESAGTAIKSGTLKAGYNYSFKFADNALILASSIPIEKVTDGVPIAYYIIRDAMITALTRLGGITDYNIDDIGEYYAMPQYNENYEQYRIENPLWNNIPYDLDFNVGDNVLSIITTLRDLYPNYEVYFNEDAVFCCNMIPSEITDDDVYLSNDYLQEVLISENYDIDTTTIRNVCEVWGQSLEVDFTAETCTLSGNTYTIHIPEYGDTIYAGDVIAIQIENQNPSYAKIVIHTTYTEAKGEGTVTREKTFDPLEIYDEMTDQPLASNVLEVGTVYVFKIKTKLVNGTTPIKYIYYQSEYQPQAIDVLTDGSVSSKTWTCADGSVVNVWSKEYFADKYGCKKKNIHFTVDGSSALTVQKLGELLSVKQGGEFENITSDQRAIARAQYENWKMARIADTISIVIKLCPFLDVNKKVEFLRHDQKEIGYFIITSVSHDLAAGTSSVTLTRFWPLYLNGIYDG